MLAGETVQDSNLPAAEGLIRNFTVAMPLYRELCGGDHPGLKLAWVEDAFGNSPNYPQVLRGVGAEVVCHTSYRPCPEPVWVGIDGSKILCYDHAPKLAMGVFEKHPPCFACRGRGCADCDQTGLVLLQGFDLNKLRELCLQAATSTTALASTAVGGAFAVGGAAAALTESPATAIFVVTEEFPPDVRLPDFVDAINKELAGAATVRLANPTDVYAAARASLERSLEQRDDSPSADLNPGMPGCYVSRIAMKQRTRAIAYELLVAEAQHATRAWASRTPCILPADLTEAWRLVCFNQFHDAITGTHIDSANAELHDMLDTAHAIAVAHACLPDAKPGVDAFVSVDQSGSIKLGAIDVTFDRQGIQTMLLDGVDVFGHVPSYATYRRPLRIAELVLEADFGDAWGQRIEAFTSPSTEISRVALGDFNTRVEVAADAIRWSGQYDGGDPMVRKLAWTVTARLSSDGRRIDMVTELDWDTQSRRLRMLLPVKSSDPTATYEVPFGFIDRAYEPDKLNFGQWHSNTLEFPTLHWVRKAIDDRQGVALLNKGLPCNRWVSGGWLDLSLLRSPQWQFCVVEPGSYEFWDIDGQRDTGHHRLEYSIWPYTDGLSTTELIRAGYAYNLPASIDPPFTISGDALVTAWKPADDGSGWILRLQDTTARGCIATIDFGRTVAITPTDLLERPQGPSTTANQYAATLHRHGIITLHLGDVGR
jgi:alpha-mannosidase